MLFRSKVGLQSRLSHKPKEMSGGQQQRVGIARAFVAKPEIVFADEPTGNLDTRTTIEVMELIKQMARDNNQTIVMVTHDRSLAAYADKIIHILDGKVQSIEVTERDKQENMQAHLKEVSKKLLLERGGEMTAEVPEEAEKESAATELQEEAETEGTISGKEGKAKPGGNAPEPAGRNATDNRE